MLAAVGDLVGNWSWTVWLLIPLVVGLAVVTGLTLASDDGDDAPRAGGAERGVSRYLAHRNDPDSEAS